MSNWFHKKTRLEKLKERYRSLMRMSFEMSAKNTDKSFEARQKAHEIYEEIEHLTLRRADK